MDKNKVKREIRLHRHKRVRNKISGTKQIPRLCVFRSSKNIYSQLIDDTTGNVILSASSIQDKDHIKIGKDETGKIVVSKAVGKILAEKALKKSIKTVVFDRGGFKYHGRVKAFAEGAREGGLKF